MEINGIKLKKLIIFGFILSFSVLIASIILLFRSNRLNIVEVNDVNAIEESVGIKIVEPSDTKKISYGIEDDKIARLDYKKEVSTGDNMNFILKSSSDLRDNMIGLNNKWGIPILMTVVCDDESEIEVISYVATDDYKVMKADWYDNDKYYAMSTNNLATREDFLQEVNKVIIANHENFE